MDSLRQGLCLRVRCFFLLFSLLACRLRQNATKTSTALIHPIHSVVQAGGARMTLSSVVRKGVIYGGQQQRSFLSN